MKLNFLYTVLFLALFASCSNDEENPIGTSANYFPLTSGNFWTYDVQGQTTGRDSLYVAGDTIIEDSDFKKMKSQFLPFGFFTNSLAENGLKINGSKVVLSGGLNFDLGTGLPLNLTVSNFTVLDENASANAQLSTTTGTFSQTFDTFPLTFNYTLKSVADGSLPTFTSPDGTVYTDVKKTKIVLTLKITTTTTIPGTPFPVTLNLLDQQDVITATQYYSKDIGMVYNNTAITYEFNPQLADFLPIPASGNQTQEEFLDVYEVN